jgi:hypothetical protein
MLSSGADHDRVAVANPRWTVNDWCRYWELDMRKALRKSGESRLPVECVDGWVVDCGEGCRCKGL